MAWYRVGTVNVTNNSNTVAGIGTAWVQAAAIGETFLGPDGGLYEITGINSNTSLSINPAYKGPTSTAQNYALMPTQGYLRDLAAQAAALVNAYASVKDNAGQGKFAAGTVAAPSLRGAADENTGLNFLGNDILALVTAGVERLRIAANGVPSGTAAAHMMNRQNHTGTQLRSTISDLQPALDEKLSKSESGVLTASKGFASGSSFNALTGREAGGFYTLSGTYLDGPPLSGGLTATMHVVRRLFDVGAAVVQIIYHQNGSIWWRKGAAGTPDWTWTEWRSVAEGGVNSSITALTGLTATYATTTASAANLYITSGGILQRSTSSAKYKTQVEHADAALMQRIIDEAEPIWYRSLCDADPDDFSYWGLIAENLGAIDPRFVHWARPMKTVERYEHVEEQVDTGEVDDQGQPIYRTETRTKTVTEQVPDLDAPLQAEGVMYERLVVPLLWHAKQMQARFDGLEQRLAELEQRLAELEGAA